jgi:ABC-2 type transport system ATP-binding protein
MMGLGSTRIIETFALTRRFGTIAAVDCVALSVLRCEIFGLIGPNGAGKSTLIKMLTTLLPPTSGTARVAGFDIVASPARVRAHIGYVPQLLSADGALTAYENLLLSARLYLIPPQERNPRIKRALEMMNLAGSSDRLVQRFSGGMIRRLEIAQAMLHEPPVLFMDEPTVGLDPVARRIVWDHVQKLRDDLGITILITTHLMDEADHLCDRIGVIHAGRLDEAGTPAELKARIGPNATLDDVFAASTGVAFEAGGTYSDVRQSRNSARSHE